MAAKVTPKKLPGWSQGVRENAAARLIHLAQPICPNSQVVWEYDSTGRARPKQKNGPEEQNCQLRGEGWWDYCAEQGHDPYYTTFRWEVPQPILTVDDKGRTIKTGEELIFREDRRLNVVQVAAHIRVNSGKGVIWAMEHKGFKRLKDLGYEEVCQFRGCQDPVTAEGTSRTYGLYCGKRHLSLVAADAQEMALIQIDQMVPGPGSAKRKREREQQLREALADA